MNTTAHLLASSLLTRIVGKRMEAAVLLGLVSLVSFSALSQKSEIILSGLVVNSEHNPIAFVAVALGKTGKGVVSDIDGRFRLTISNDYEGKVIFQHLGHYSKTLSIREIQSNSVISLVKKTTSLEELVFESGTNPAHGIMRNVIKNRKRHNPLKMKKYSYRSYSKEIFRLEGDNKMSDSLVLLIKKKSEITQQDSVALLLADVVKNQHLFVSESVAEVKFISPGMQNETVTATHISGMKNGMFAATGTQYQPFGFYEDVIPLFDKEFISPLNPSALSQYDFFIEDTTFNESDTVFILSFVPKKNRRFEGLEGVLSVNVNDYALTNVSAETSDDLTKMAIKIQQMYDKIYGVWFPVQLNTNITFEEFQYFGRRVILDNKRYLSDIDFEAELTAKDFSDVSLSINEIDKQAQEEILNNKRVIPLDSMELRTYQKLDSVASQFESIEKIAEVMLTQRIPIGKVDLKINQIISFNAHEKVRLGIGFHTNDKFSKKLRFGGYAGYGFRDDVWKYGGDIRWEFDRRTSTAVTISYKNDLREAGFVKFFDASKNAIGQLVRGWQGNVFDRQEQLKLSLNRRIAPFVYSQLSFSSSREEPLYEYNYAGDLFSGNLFLMNEVSLSLRYVRNEQYMELYGRRLLTGSDYPIINMKVSYGNNTWLQSDFSYTRVDTKIVYRKKYVLGKSKFVLLGGYIDGELSYNDMLTGWGDNSSRFSVPYYFQTMGLYEFLSDKAAALFFNHNFGNILIATKLMKPEFMIYQNTGIGDLSHPERHETVVFNTMEKGYFESGLGLKNLFRMNYLGIGYLGVGMSVFYRYGPYQLDNTSDNLAYKFNLNFSF